VASVAPAAAAPVAPGSAAAKLREVSRSRYAVAAEIGRGGLGRVLRARDLELDRAVAIKELHADDDDSRRRFVREALITARLQHPSIVPVYEAGRWADQSPFYAMKLVAGRSLDKVIATAKTLSARLAIVPMILAVSDAIAYAHAERVIHRDLKPHNILVGAFGESIVIDWGLAKDLSIDDHEALPVGPYRSANADQTVAGSVLGTPAYMAPEQAAGEDTDERADVYALGAILYHLISGRSPHADSSIERILERAVSGDIEPLNAVEPDAPVDLLAIVAKAMAHDRDARYRDAKALADDLRRFTTGKLVAAHHYTLSQRAMRWLRRYRAVALVATAALAALIVFGAWSFHSIGVERDQAGTRAAEATANATEAILSHARAELDRDPAESLAWLARLDTDSEQAWLDARSIAADALTQPRLELSIDLGIPDAELTVSRDRYLASSYDRLVVIDPSTRTTTSYAIQGTGVFDRMRWELCADGKRAVGLLTPRLVSRAYRAFELDLASHQISPRTGPDVSLASLGACTGQIQIVEAAGKVAWWNPRDRLVRPLTEADRLYTSSDGQRAVTVDSKGHATWWDPLRDTSRDLGSVDGETPVALSRDGNVVVLGSSVGSRVVHIDRGDAQELGAGVRVAIAPDGTWAAAVNSDGEIHVWRANGIRSQSQRLGVVDSIAVSDDSRSLLVVGGERATLLDTWTESIRTLPTRTGHALIGHRLWSVTEGILRFWRIEYPPVIALGGTEAGFSPDGRFVLSSSDTGLVRYDRRSHARPERIVDPRFAYASISDGAVGNDGTLLMAERGQVWLWLPGNRPRALHPLDDHFDLTWSPDGIPEARGERVIYKFDKPNGAPRVVWRSPDAAVVQLASTPDLAWLALPTKPASLSLFETATGSMTPLPGSDLVVAFATDGSKVACGRADRAGVIVHDLVTHRSRTISIRNIEVERLLFSPDSATLAVTTGTRLYLIDLTTESVVGIDARVGKAGIAFDPTGTRLVFGAASGPTAGTALWDQVTRQHRMLTGAVASSIRFDGDTIELLTGRALITLRDDLPRAPYLIRKRLRALPYRLDREAVGAVRVTLDSPGLPASGSSP